MIKRVRGTEDIFNLQPEQALVNAMRGVLAQHNFTEISLPLFESTDLFARSLGTSTDVVSKEMYTFAASGGESISLRPESTASTTRAFLESGIQERPWKTFTYGPMFRHERPQKGRWRQFNQLSIESIGSDNIIEDALFIQMLCSLFAQTLELKNFQLQINWLGTIADREAFKKTLLTYLEAFQDQICETCQTRLTKNTLRIFDCKNKECQNVYTAAPRLTDSLAQESKQQWQTIQRLLQELNVPYSINSSLVRGLDYYSGIVFEFTSDHLGTQSAFCGGGRYELASQLDGPEVPSMGAAIGIGRVLMVQEAEQKLFLSAKKNLVAILPLSSDQHEAAMHVYAGLMDVKITAEIVLNKSSVKSLFRKADALEAQHVIIIGEQEVSSKQYVLKNMSSGEQITESLDSIIQKLQSV